MKKNFDIDVDMPDRGKALDVLKHYKASQKRGDVLSNHATGVYFTEVPHDVNGLATIDYKQAEDRGYFKIDLLNMSVYERVKGEEHLRRLMETEPPWHKLTERKFCEKLVHIGNYWPTICTLKEPIDSIPRMAMFLAAIRPGKKHLIGMLWKDVAKTIWDKTEDGYTFKKSHAISYAHLVVVHMNLLEEHFMTYGQYV